MSDGHAVGRVGAALVALVLVVLLGGCGSTDRPGASPSATTAALTGARLEALLLTEADLPAGVAAARVEETGGDPPPPDAGQSFCGQGPPTEGFVPSANAVVQFASNDPSLEGNGPSSWIVEGLTAHPPGEAEAVMAAYREALAGCPTETSLHSTATGSQTTLPVDAVGDDHLAFTVILADPAFGIEFASDFVLVRNGDLLTTLVTSGVDHDTTRAIVSATQTRIDASDG